MPTNEDGEFELILGNKQLLSVFFIVVVLLGVFFAMGYVVGRNSAPLRAEGTAGTKTAAAESQRSAAEAGTSPMPLQTAPPQQDAAPPVPEPLAERREPAKSTPAYTPPEEKVNPLDTPPPGTYWQVAATKRAEADMLVDLLKGKGFRARLVRVPTSDGYYRVIVGPAPTTKAMSELKASLEAAGYKQPIKRDY